MEETMKNSSFCRMGENRITILSLQSLTLFFPQTARGAEVEIPRVLIIEGAMANFCPLAPIGCGGSIYLTKSNFCQGAQAVLKRGEQPGFF
jgi:hypothetical protein